MMHKDSSLQATRYACAAITLTLAAFTLSGCGAHTESPTTNEKITPVHVVTPLAGPAAAPLLTTGILTTADELKLSFKLGGVVQAIKVREGEVVKAGQVLAELMSAEINAQLAQVQQLNDKAQRDLARGDKLYADQVISLEQFQNLQTQAKVAAAQLAAARFNQGWVRITAPVAGTVLRKLLEDHEAVGPGQPVVVLGGAQRGFIIKAALADRDVVQLHNGDVAKVRLDTLPNIELSGRVTTVGGAASIENGLFPLEVTLDPETLAHASSLVAGMVAQLQLLPDTTSNGKSKSLLYVPTGAVVAGIGDEATVFIASGDIAKKRKVQVAFFTRDQVALHGGLEAGEQVITDGALYLSDGEKICVLAESAVAGSTP